MKLSKKKIVGGLFVAVATIVLYDHVMINKQGSDILKTLTMCWFVWLFGFITSDNKYSVVVIVPNVIIKHLVLLIIASLLAVPTVMLTWYYFGEKFPAELNQCARILWLFVLWFTMWIRSKIFVITGKVTK